MKPELDQTQGLLGGLVTQHTHRRRLETSPWAQLINAPLPRLDRTVPAAHCWRSVSKRTLSAPVSFCAGGLFVYLGVGSSWFYNEQGAGNGALINPAPSAFQQPALPNPFWNNEINTSTERGRVDGLVLIGVRASLALYTIFREQGGANRRWRANSVTTSMLRYLATYTTLRVQWSDDDADPWLDDVPLTYLERPDRRFVAVPPLLWSGRGVRATLQGRVADYGAAQGQIPDVRSGVATLFANTEFLILMEGLFIAPPDACGADWPGAYCPPEVIGNHPRYDRDFLTR